jgi:hypothetical protein
MVQGGDGASVAASVAVITQGMSSWVLMALGSDRVLFPFFLRLLHA